jgi:hypothetical protein
VTPDGDLGTTDRPALTLPKRQSISPTGTRTGKTAAVELTVRSCLTAVERSASAEISALLLPTLLADPDSYRPVLTAVDSKK